MPLEELGQVKIDFEIDWQKVNRSLNRVDSAVKKISKRMGRNIKSALGGLVNVSMRVTKRLVGLFTNAFKRIVRIVRNAMLISGAAIAGLLAISVKAATKQEDALFALQTALKLTGDDTESAMKDYQEFASALQKTTVIGDETTLMLLAQHKQLGVNTKDLKKAAEMTIGLSAATGRGQDTITRYVAEALQGEFNSLKRIIPELKGVTDRTKSMAIITKFASNGMKVAQGRILTTSGALQQMNNAVGDVTEVIGAPFLASIVKSSKAIQKFAEDNQKQIGEWAQVVSDKFDKVKEKLFTIETFNKMKEGFKSITAIVTPFINKIKEAIKILVEWGKKKENIDRIKSALDTIVDVGKSVVSGIIGMGRAIKAFVLDLAVTDEELGDAGVALFDFLTIMEALRKLARKMADGFVWLNEKIGDVKNETLKAILVFAEFTLVMSLLRSPIKTIIGLFGAFKLVVTVLGNTLIWVAKKTGLTKVAMISLKGALLGIKLASGFVITAFLNVGKSMLILITKTIPALIVSLVTSGAAVKVFAATVVAAQWAIVTMGLAAAAIVGWKIGQWAVDNVAGVDFLSTAVSRLVIWLTKAINLIPGINIGGIGTFGSDGDPNATRSADIGSIMSRAARVNVPVASPAAITNANMGKNITKGEAAQIVLLKQLVTETKMQPKKEHNLNNRF